MDDFMVDGQCNCKSKVQSRRCNQCIDGCFNLTRNNVDGCEECLCEVNGTKDRRITCHPVCSVDYTCNSYCLNFDIYYVET